MTPIRWDNGYAVFEHGAFRVVVGTVFEEDGTYSWARSDMPNWMGWLPYHWKRGRGITFAEDIAKSALLDGVFAIPLSAYAACMRPGLN